MRQRTKTFNQWSLYGVASALVIVATLLAVQGASAQPRPAAGKPIFLPALMNAAQGTSVAGGASAAANAPVNGAAFTTVNEDVDGAGHCKNGNPNNNCNIYDGKQYVWLSGGPAVAYVGDGQYFFAVLSPGGQANPNDGDEKNLSDLSPTTNTGAGDAYTNRIYTVTGGVISYSGTHDFANNKLRLLPYDDTPNPGGEYILAICALPDGKPADEYQVDPSDCKYDAFKIKSADQAFDPAVTKDADGTYDTTFAWAIDKQVSPDEIYQSSTAATASYSVILSHDDGSVSNVVVMGTIKVENFNIDGAGVVAVSGVNVTDELSDGTICTVTGGAGVTLTAAETLFTYECTLGAVPKDVLNNTVTVTWPDQALANGKALAAGSSDFTFETISFTQSNIDECVQVLDSLGGGKPDDLGTVCVGDPNPKTITYDRTLTGKAGTCSTFNNTATFTADDTYATNYDTASVKLCVGADLTVSKTAIPSFTRTYGWAIDKAVDKAVVKQYGGTATFNYTVKVDQTGFADSAWQVKGVITVSNPNDWQAITANVADQVDNGGVCTLDVPAQATVAVPASGSVDVPYTCTYPSAPTAVSGTNTATATWDEKVAYTPSGSASGTAGFAFTTPTTSVNKTITVQDTFDGSTTVLGTVTATDAEPWATQNFTYARTLAVPAYNCKEYTNLAEIKETGQSDKETVRVCGPIQTGAKTIGFWQNKNGQGIITGGAATSGVCNSGTWLRQYAPFQDLSATATCAQVGTYATNVIKAANASGSSMNAMLKAQMLATALDVYFSDAALGGNKIGAPAPLGGVTVDLTLVCKMSDSSSGGTCTGSIQNVSAAFGGATSLTVQQMLTYAASQSNVGGSLWYSNVKATQEMAKNAFDAINNEKVFAP